MKFAKVLSAAAEDMPVEMRQQFLQYKQLKKKIKNIPLVDSSASEGQRDKLSPEEKEFLAALNEDMDQFNSYFMEKEEMAVIRLQAISDAIRNASSEEEAQRHKARLVDFHGEVVLLLHWSLLNYAAVVKILKKHDKHSGVLLRAPYLAKLLHQPFQSTTVMSQLVKKAEELVQDALATSEDGGANKAPSTQEAGEGAHQTSVPSSRQNLGASTSGPAGSRAASVLSADLVDEVPDNSEDDETIEASSLPFDMDVSMAKCTKLALETWEALARGASTPSTVLTQQQHQMNMSKRKASGSVDMEGSEAKQGEMGGPEAKRSALGDGAQEMGGLEAKRTATGDSAQEMGAPGAKCTASGKGAHLVAASATEVAASWTTLVVTCVPGPGPGP
eukprot:gene8655-34107_t